MAAVRILHLVWAPLGPELLAGFLDELDAHPAGIETELTVILNGFARREDAAPWLELLDGRTVEPLWTPEPMQDVGAYGYAAARVTGDLVCLMNSYARPRRDGWLALLADAKGRPGVAAAGATGSWESHGTELGFRARWRISRSWRDRVGGIYDWARYRVLFPRFPNPHLRTNGLLCERSLVAEALRPPPADKEGAFVLESGRRGLSRAATRGGGELVVVGRDGRSFAAADWPDSATYRSREQENVLIADNRTEDWHRLSGEERQALALRAWGRSTLAP